MLFLSEHIKNNWVRSVTAALFLLAIAATPLRAQENPPDLNGIWQALGTAHWDLEGHAARAGPIVELGALGAIPAGLSVVVGGKDAHRAAAGAEAACSQPARGITFLLCEDLEGARAP